MKSILNVILACTFLLINVSLVNAQVFGNKKITGNNKKGIERPTSVV